MGSKRYGAQSSGAKRNWTQREWQLYVEMPWLVRRVVDLLMHFPRFAGSTDREIEGTDRRSKFVKQKLLAVRHRRAGRWFT